MIYSEYYNLPHKNRNGVKGWFVWFAHSGGEFTGDPTSLACDNIIYCPGCALVVSAVGGLQEIVEEGVNGFKIAQGEEEEFTKAVRKLVNNRTMLEMMKRQNVETANAKYSWMSTVNKLLEQIANIV